MNGLFILSNFNVSQRRLFCCWRTFAHLCFLLLLLIVAHQNKARLLQKRIYNDENRKIAIHNCSNENENKKKPSNLCKSIAKHKQPRWYWLRVTFFLKLFFLPPLIQKHCFYFHALLTTATKSKALLYL